MSEESTFAQRVEQMLAAARDLRDALDRLSPAVEVVEQEAQAMQAAQERFEAKKPKGGAIRK
jgi:prefoldin subunit 5